MERPDGVIRRASGVDDAQCVVRPHNAADAAPRMASAASASCCARRC